MTYYLPKKNQFEVFTAILPTLESVLLLLEKGHPSSKIDQDGTKQVCNELGIGYYERLCSSKEDAVQAVQDHAGKVSAIIIGNQAVVIDNALAIIEAAGDIPVLSYSSKPAKVGALGGFVADDAKLGQMLAESLVEVVVHKKPIQDVPVKFDPEPKFYLNAQTVERLGVEIPYSILESATLIE